MEKELMRREKRLKADREEEEELEQDDKNKFSNDGSFLELFKNKMKEKNEPRSESNDTARTSGVTHNIKSIQAGVGRPKALQKSLELREKRKRRREEAEEQKRLEESQQTQEGKAWRKYLAEMKAYEERLCIDSDNNSTRPLVK